MRMSGKNVAIDWSGLDAVLFDLDGVLTPTASIHERAWTDMFNSFLAEHAGPERDAAPWRSFVESRAIHLPEGTHDDPPGFGSVGALGNLKNATFQRILRTEGIRPYPGSLRVLDALAARGTAMAVVSSSKNAPEVLEASGLAPRFDVVVDGSVAGRLGLIG